jgi:hypothetical protein
VELIEVSNPITDIEKSEKKPVMRCFVAVTQDDLNRGISPKQKELIHQVLNVYYLSREILRLASQNS